LAREAPLHLGHLRTLSQLAEMGAIILPVTPAFYAAPYSLSDMVDQIAGRALDLLGYDWPKVKRWGEDLPKGRRKGQGRAIRGA
jgi:4-hydroxy-3-polyprenylbenzoate decarboxylase